MDKLCRQIMIALLIAIILGVSLYFDVRIYSVFDLSKITLLNMLVFALIITWCIKRIFGSGDTYVYNKLLIPIACYVLVAIASTKFAIDPSISMLGSYKRYNGLSSLLIYLFMFFIIVNYVSKNEVDLLINIIILSTCLMCVYGVAQSCGIDFFNWNTGHGHRIQGTIGHPAFFSAYLIMTIPLVYYRAITQSTVFGFMFYLSLVVLIVITFYMTKTRASFIALVISNIFFFSLMGGFLLRRKRYQVIIILFTVICISVVFNTKDKSVIDRFKSEISVGGDVEKNLTGTALKRYDNISIALRVVSDYPFLGVGLDNFGVVYPKYAIEMSKEKGRDMIGRELQDRVHSDIFDVLVTTGILGLCAYAFCIYSYIRMMWCSRNEHRFVILALGSGVLAYFIQNQFSFGHVPIITLFWILVGLSVIVCRTNILTRSSTQS